MVYSDGINYVLSHYPPVRGNIVPKFKIKIQIMDLERDANISVSSSLRAAK